MKNNKDIYKEPVSRQPEYERLGIEPKSGGTSLLHDEIGGPLVKKVVSPKLAAPEITNERVCIKHDEPKDEDIKYANAAIARRAPTAVPCSGFVDQLWSDGVIIDSDADGEMIDNNEIVEIDALQGLDPLAGIRANAKFVVMAGAEGKASPVKPEEFPYAEQGYGKLEDIAEGDYAIVFKNELVFLSEDFNATVDAVENILLKDGVILEDISVFQRLKLSFGVSIK